MLAHGTHWNRTWNELDPMNTTTPNLRLPPLPSADKVNKQGNGVVYANDEAGLRH
jgi:hypothetical protein